MIGIDSIVIVNRCCPDPEWHGWRGVVVEAADNLERKAGMDWWVHMDHTDDGVAVAFANFELTESQ